MSRHSATIRWSRGSETLDYNDYKREHVWEFDGGISVPATAAPEYFGSESGHLDPEEALVAALSSCHMLTFLAICAKRGISVDSYTDTAQGYLEKNTEGKLALTRVELQPQIEFSGETPDADSLDRLHHQAHKHCFIANSVRTEVKVV